MQWFLSRRKLKTLCRIFCKCVLVITTLLLLVLYYIDNDRSFWPIPHLGLISHTEGPYVQTFPERQFGPNRKNKVILIWSKYFKTYEWVETIKKHTTHCNVQCEVINDRNELLNSDGILFHFTDKDLFWYDLPPQRLLHQVWAIYINEPNIFVQESFTRWKNVFNWTVSYRRHSTVFTPYGMFQPNVNASMINPSIYPAINRDKMAYAIISRCADDAERYKLVDEISKYIEVDYFGDCGNLKCEIKANSCLAPKNLRRYRFRLAFEDSNCRDYVTEKYWDTLAKGIIPVVNWKEAQRDVPVPPNSFINVYDFKDIKSLADYLLKVSKDRLLFESYFKWTQHYKIYTTFWNSFCNFCIALNNKSIPSQVYTNLEGWIRDDYCERFTVSIYNDFLFSSLK